MSENLGKSGTTIESLIGQLSMEIRRKTVASLLEGNDVQCFTTDQYMDRYLEKNRLDDQYKDGWIRWWDKEGLARMHLESLGMVEVKPDVWKEAN
jgi:hypothetical protein